MIKTQRPGIFQGDGTAQSHATEDLKAGTPRQGQINELEKILVPAHRDAIFGYTAKTQQNPVIQIFLQGTPVTNGCAQPGLGQGFDFQTINAHYRAAFLKKMMGHGEARRAHTCHQHFAAIVGLCSKLYGPQRVPAGQ